MSTEQDISTDLELAPRSPADLDSPISGGEMETLYRLANGLAQSGFFKDAKQAQQAFAKLVFGRDLGLSATQAMTDIHIVEGKPELSANLQAGKVKNSARYDYRVDELTNDKCCLTFLEDGNEVGVSEFTMEDAKLAGLAGKNNWKSYPRNMLFARAISNGVAWYCPDVLNGIRVYAEGEISEAPRAAPEQQNGAGPVVDGEVQAPAPLSDEERTQLLEALEAAGIDDNELTMLLTAVGVDCTEDLNAQTAYELRQRLGEHLARKGAAQ